MIAPMAATAPAGASQQMSPEEVVSLLAGHLKGHPEGSYDFEATEIRNPPPADWEEQAQAQFARSIAATMAARPVTPEPVELVHSAWEQHSEQHLGFVDRAAFKELETTRSFHYEIGSDFVEFETEMQLGPRVDESLIEARMSVLYTDRERIQVIASRVRSEDGGSMLQHQAQRSLREAQDVELADNTRWLFHSYAFPRTVLESLRVFADDWTCSRDGDEVVMRWSIDTPGDWPGFYFYQGLVSGTVEMRLDANTGAPVEFACRDATGRDVHTVRYGGFAGHRDVVPLSIEIRTWYPGAGVLRSSESYKGIASRIRRRQSEYAELIPIGTVVSDARFSPPVTYVEADEPLSDEDVVSLSSEHAEEQMHEQRSDLILDDSHDGELEATTVAALAGPAGGAGPPRPVRWSLYGGIATIAAAGGWYALQRTRRSA